MDRQRDGVERRAILTREGGSYLVKFPQRSLVMSKFRVMWIEKAAN